MTDPISSSSIAIVAPASTPVKIQSAATAPTTSTPASWGPDPSAISIALKPGANVDDALRQGLQSIYDAFYKNDPTASKNAVEKALASVKSAIDNAAITGAEKIQLRIATVATRYGNSGDAVSVGGASELGIETAFVKSGRITSGQTALVNLTGDSLSLSASQISQGHVAGFYQRTQDLSGLGTLTPENAKYLQDAQKALGDIQRTADVLSAYVKGNLQPLNDLIKQQLGGTT